VQGTLHVGFSGGRDSTVLLHAVAAERRDGVVAVHVNHGLRPEADGWQEHCGTVAGQLGVAFAAHRVTVSGRGSREAGARAARYRVFTDLLVQPNDRLLLAHHRQDQAETVLLRMLQGRGLYGMPRQRPLGAGLLVRPLLDVAPQVLDSYARRHGLSWVEDPTNADQQLDRNFLRHRVLPDLRQRWPDVDRALLHAMQHHHRANALIMARLGAAAAADSLTLSLLEQCAPDERVELLRLWLQSHGIRAPSRVALRELARQLTGAGADRQPRLGLDGATVRRHGGRVYLTRPAPALEPGYPVVLPGATRLPHGELEVVPDPAGFRPAGPVEVRFRVGGERLEAGGHHRSLKQLFQQAGVPAWQRASYPLLFDAEGLLAVPGVAQRDSARAGAERPATSGGWRAEWRPRTQA
jgi:tRNA(Ile)-lysidine synthase